MHLDGQRLEVGLLGGIVLASVPVDHAGLVPSDGDAHWLAEFLKHAACVCVGNEGLVVAALEHPDGAQLVIVDGRIPRIATFLVQRYGLFIHLGCLVEPPETPEAVAAFCDRD